MKRGVEFPAVDVIYDGEEYWLYDGFHRVRAAMKQERDTIEAKVKQGTKEDAVWKSLAANQDHGLQRSQEDKERAVKRALRHEMGTGCSDREIARHVGCSHPFVGDIREEMVSTGNISSEKQRRGKDGRLQDTSNIGSSSGSSDSSDTGPYDPETRGDGAPSSDGFEGDAGDGGAVTVEQAVRRVCNRLEGIAQEPSRLTSELIELVDRADEDEIPAEKVDALRTELESVAQRFLSYARRFHPSPESDSLYNHDRSRP